MVTDFMGNDATVRSLVAQFLSHRGRSSHSASTARASSSAANVSRTVASGRLACGSGQGGQEVRGPPEQLAPQCKTSGSGFRSTGGRVLVDLHAQEVCGGDIAAAAWSPFVEGACCNNMPDGV